MKYFTSLVILSLVPTAVAFGQGNSGMRVDRLGVVLVRNLPPANPSATRSHSHAVIPEDSELFQGEKQQAQMGVGGVAAPALTQTPSSLVFGTSFAGLTLGDTLGDVPPDTQIAAGATPALNLVEMVNGAIRVSDGLGNPIKTVDSCSFFFCDFFTVVISDPIVRYDPDSQRWFASIVTIEYVVKGVFLTPEGQWRLAVSQSSDPSAAWTVYAATMTNGTFPDFPKMAVGRYMVVQTGDAFTVSNERFKGTEFAALNKADLVAGVQTPGFQYFAPPQGLFALAAAELLPSSSIASTVYMAALNASRNKFSVRVWQLNGVPNTGGTGVTVTTTDYPVAPFATPPNAPQLGTSTLIDTNGDFLIDAFFQNGRLWVAAHSGCVPAGDTTTRSCLRLVGIAPGLTPAVVQDLTFGEPGKYYYFPAIRPDGSGNLIAVFNRSSSSEYVGVYASGQLITAPNTFQTPVLMKAGETAYTISPPRWGDYSGASLDPTNPAIVWLAAEYAQSVAGGGNQWATWIAQAHY